MSSEDSYVASTTLTRARAEFDSLVSEIRPELHRYCSRMTGSVIDGEDVVQDALAKAYYALATASKISNMRGWLFRIAHNKAIDHLRRYERSHSEPLDDDVPSAVEEPLTERADLTRIALARFLELPPMQRSCVILKDALDYSLLEISELLDVTVGAVKAALHRGRAGLRRLAAEAASSPTLPAGPEVDLLSRYVDAFAAHDFDAVRQMLADDVRLDLVGRAQRSGAVEVSGYFTNYGRLDDWYPVVGVVEGRPAILVHDPADSATPPVYFILIEWDGDRVGMIRDFRYARHVMHGADVGPSAT